MIGTVYVISVPSSVSLSRDDLESTSNVGWHQSDIWDTLLYSVATPIQTSLAGGFLAVCDCRGSPLYTWKSWPHELIPWLMTACVWPQAIYYTYWQCGIIMTYFNWLASRSGAQISDADCQLAMFSKQGIIHYRCISSHRTVGLSLNRTPLRIKYRMLYCVM